MLPTIPLIALARSMVNSVTFSFSMIAIFFSRPVDAND